MDKSHEFLLFSNLVEIYSFLDNQIQIYEISIAKLALPPGLREVEISSTLVNQFTAVIDLCLSAAGKNEGNKTERGLSFSFFLYRTVCPFSQLRRTGCKRERD